MWEEGRGKNFLLPGDTGGTLGNSSTKNCERKKDRKWHFFPQKHPRLAGILNTNLKKILVGSLIFLESFWSGFSGILITSFNSGNGFLRLQLNVDFTIKAMEKPHFLQMSCSHQFVFHVCSNQLWFFFFSMCIKAFKGNFHCLKALQPHPCRN